jgi:membrane-associated phospholipid phosphatase
LKNTKLYLLTTAILIALSFCLDAPVRAFVVSHQIPALHEAARFISKYGAWQWLMTGCALFFGLAAWRGNADLKRLLVTMMIVSSIAGLLADATRNVTGRARPNSGIAPGWYGPRHDGHWLIGDPRYNAFPSGHTAAATGLVAPLLLLRRRPGWLLLPVPVAIAGSRLYLGAHNFSDIVTSALLAFAVAGIWLRCVGVGKDAKRANN